MDKMSFEELVNLQKSLNDTITKKRKSDVGDLIRELKILHKKRRDLDKKIDGLQRIISFDNLNEILKRNHKVNCFFDYEFHLLVYNQDQKKEMTIDLEAMQIVKSKGFLDDEINSILNITNDFINGKGDETDELLKTPYSEQLEIFKVLESDDLITDDEMDDFLDRYNLLDVDLQRFVREFKYNENGAKNEE